MQPSSDHNAAIRHRTPSPRTTQTGYRSARSCPPFQVRTGCIGSHTCWLAPAAAGAHVRRIVGSGALGIAAPRLWPARAPAAVMPHVAAHTPPPHLAAAIGFNVETVTYKNIKFQVWDLGGQTSIRPYWRCYYPNTQVRCPATAGPASAAAASLLVGRARTALSGPRKHKTPRQRARARAHTPRPPRPSSTWSTAATWSASRPGWHCVRCARVN